MKTPYRFLFMHVTVLLLIGACGSVPQSSLTAQTPQKDAHTPTPSQTKVTPTLSPGYVLGGSLIIQTWDDSSKSFDLWLLDLPTLRVRPLYVDDAYNYGVGLWSPDGEQIAIVRTSGVCPTFTSGVWSHNVETSETRLLFEVTVEYDCANQPRPYHFIWPLAWTLDSQKIAVDVQQVQEIDTVDGPRQILRPQPYLLEVQTGQLISVVDDLSREEDDHSQYVKDHLTWQSFAPAADLALLAASPEASLEPKSALEERELFIVCKLFRPPKAGCGRNHRLQAYNLPGGGLSTAIPSYRLSAGSS